MNPHFFEPLLEGETVEAAKGKKLHTVLDSAQLVFDCLQPCISIHEVDESIAGDSKAVVMVEGAMDWLAEDRESDPQFSLSFQSEGEEIVIPLSCYYCEIAVSVGMSAEEGVGWGVRDAIRDGFYLYPVNLVAFAKLTAHANNYMILYDMQMINGWLYITNIFRLFEELQN